MNETVIAALNYRIEALTGQVRDLERRLLKALADVEKYKARTIEECEARALAELKLDECRARL